MLMIIMIKLLMSQCSVRVFPRQGLGLWPGKIISTETRYLSRQTQPCHPPLEMFFFQVLSGMASKVPFTEDRVALAGNGGWW